MQPTRSQSSFTPRRLGSALILALSWVACVRPPAVSDEASAESDGPTTSGETGATETAGSSCPKGHVHEGDLVITDQTSAEDVACIQEVTGSLVVRDTGQLTGLELLAELRAVRGSVSIMENEALSTLDGLQQLLEVDHEISVELNPVLVDASALAGVERFGGGSFSWNAALTQLPQFQALTLVAEPPPQGEPIEPVGLAISSNAALTDLDALAQADPTAPQGVAVYVGGNPNLHSIEGLSSFAVLGSGLHLEIRDNESLTELPQLGTQAGSIRLDNLPAVVDLFDFEQVVELEGLRIEATGIADLQGLEALESITRGLHIGDCDPLDQPDGLVSLQGLEGLRSVSGLMLVGNANLADASALLGLEPTATNVVWIADNPALPAEQGQALADLLVGDPDPVVCGNGGSPFCEECPPSGD